MKTIWHHGAWNRNFGDWVLCDSIHHHLPEVYGEPIRFVNVDSQKTVYSRLLIEKLNDEADLLLIGGGGLIFNRPEDNSVSGWQFNIRYEDIDLIRRPFILYGLGYNRFPFDKTPFPDVLDRHLRRVQDRSSLFSVRNLGTRDELVRRGLDPSRIRVVPDSGVFSPCRALNLRRFFNGHRIIGLNVAGDRPAHRYPAPASSNELKCMDHLALSLRETCIKNDARVLLLPHILDIDERFDGLLRDTIGRDRVFSLRELLPEVYPPSEVTASLLVGAYDECDLVIGMRGHACLLSLGRGRPFVAYGAHDKNIFLIDQLGLKSALVTPHDVLSGRISIRDAADMFSAIMFDDSIPPLLRQHMAMQNKVFQKFNGDIANILHFGVSS